MVKYLQTEHLHRLLHSVENFTLQGWYLRRSNKSVCIRSDYICGKALQLFSKMASKCACLHDFKGGVDLPLLSSGEGNREKGLVFSVLIVVFHMC